ncbi:hypothetical protein NOR_06133 [Metarhizium rileyi]|uniref:Uncharacterized protein n=1 Tax=Metarhizium rileyi (strain RCEF 4871) TaxID=1649241 RepID=A0A167B6T7_METRR|nr:hypothetical protein NOR_06133 [Metarhizium rileyi RCEF 4871]
MTLTPQARASSQAHPNGQQYVNYILKPKKRRSHRETALSLAWCGSKSTSTNLGAEGPRQVVNEVPAWSHQPINIHRQPSALAAWLLAGT